MAGELVPLVLLPRYTTYAGANDYVTVAMDVTQYQNAILNMWRGPAIGTSPTVSFTFEESTDQVSWSTCTGGGPFTPSANAETQAIATLGKRWFRVKVTLGGTDPIVTCWVVGFLEERLS